MALATDPGSTGIPYLTVGVFALSVGITIVNSGNSITMGTTPFASTGTIRGDKSFSVLARNNGNSADVGVIAVAVDVITIGDATVTAGTVRNTKTGTTHLSKVNSTTITQVDSTGLYVPTASIRMGASPSSAGDVRLSNQQTISWRNGADSGNLQILTVDGSDLLSVGNNAIAGTNFNVATGATYTLQVNTTTEYTFSSTSLDLSTNFLAQGVTPRASTGDYRVPSDWSLLARNAANSADVNLISKASTANQVTVGDGNASVTSVQAGSNIRFAVGVNLWQVVAGGLQWMPATTDCLVDFLASATAATGFKFTVRGQNRTASTGTSVGGANEDFGGNATGATATHTGGRRASVGGSATGASGTRRGGDHWLGPGTGGGTGTSGPGNMYFGKTDPVSFNWQAMTGGMAIENVTDVPTGNPTGAGYLYSDAGAGKWRGTGGTVTTFGPAEPHCQRCGADFAHEWQSDKYGHLAVCIKCLVGALERSGIAADEWVITRKVA